MIRQKGYTLIEILVGLSIIGLLFAVGYVNFRDFSRRQAIAGAGKLLQGDLRVAQQLALSGQKPTDANCAGTNGLTGYYFELSSTEYKIYAGCSGGVSTEITKEIFLPTGISVSPLPSPNPILFKVLGHGTNIPEGGTAEIILIQSQTNNTFTVTVGAGGDIQ